MQTLDEHIAGLRRNIHKIQVRIDDMNGPEYCPPNACCPSCFWGEKLTNIEEALERRLHYLDVLLCRKAGLRPKKEKYVNVKVPCGCGNGRTTLFSVGLCRCGEPDCPGRGICHICKGRGWKWGRRLVVVRPWPAEFKDGRRAA